MKSICGIALSAVVLATLTACGSGGGGGGGTLQPDVGSQPVGRPVQTITMTGVSQTATATNDGAVVQSWSNASIDDSNSNIALGLDAAGNVASFSINTPQSSVSFTGSEIRCDSPGACAAANANSLGAFMDSEAMGWSYQSFGVWLKDITKTSFQVGAISVGNVTPASALPTHLTNAAFSGHASGFYVDGAGNVSITDARMNALVNFGTRNIEFSTTGTLLTDRNTLERTTNTGLDLAGKWNYGENTSQFSGPVSTKSGLSGNATGRFFGPNAEEIGGVYGLTSTTDLSRMIGAFGGKR